MNKWKLESGFELPKVGLGTWLMGGGVEADYSEDEKSISAIKSAIEMGYTHIDTAEMYGAGHSEELIGQAIKGFDRSKLIIASKVLKQNLRHDDLLKSAEKSLERLGTDYFDVFYIHSPSKEIPLKESMKAMDKLVDDGLAKNIAVSNFNLDLLKKAQSLSNHKIVANQIEYSLLTRETGQYGSNTAMESKTVPYCQENDILVVAERPVERGALLKPNTVMAEMVEKYGKTQAQIAINWLVSQKNVVTIPMSHNPEHLKQNLEAGEWVMEESDIKKLRNGYSDK